MNRPEDTLAKLCETLNDDRIGWPERTQSAQMILICSPIGKFAGEAARFLERVVDNLEVDSVNRVKAALTLARRYGWDTAEGSSWLSKCFELLDEHGVAPHSDESPTA